MSPHSVPLSSSEEDSVSSRSSGRQPATYTNGNSTSATLCRPKMQHRVKEHSKYLERASLDLDQEYDLVCVGFGPASLAVGVALHDALSAGRALLPDGRPPKVMFLEKQSNFAWHAGMLLPGAKMQISFVKDLATLRDPRSEFTFLNYLHQQGRLVDFTNLDTFLPARSEYEDYLRWCSEAFGHVVQYGYEVASISPSDKVQGMPAKGFEVRARNVKTGETKTCRGRNVLVATGGQASLPKSLPAHHPRVIHSSQYAHMVPQILRDPKAPYRVTVIGAGQSAAEIFNNIQTLYPNSQTKLVMRQEFLRPSDDSPFVNAVFNPEYIDMVYPKSAGYRNNFISEARATNYGVVRLELIEHLYERMYGLRCALGPDERCWPHRIMGGRRITAVEVQDDETVRIKTAEVQFEEEDFSMSEPAEEEWEADLVVAATGYRRDAHVNMLKDTWSLLPQANKGVKSFEKPVTGWTVNTEDGARKMAVDRSYQVQYEKGAVAQGAGVWLQGCCEGTHGLSDTLLSVLATRSGEIVDTIFGREGAAR